MPASPSADPSPVAGLSVFLIAKNEADRIGAVLAAVRGITDDLVVIDSGSTDDTVAVAERFGARVIHNDWVGFGPQKRFGEEQCRHDWLLNLDADEVPSLELLAEIRALFAPGEPQARFFRFRIKHVYPGDTKPRLWADYHNYVRLYDRRVGRFRDSLVYDEVVTGTQPVGQLHQHALHYSIRSFEHMAEKLRAYSTLTLSEKKKKRRFAAARLPLEFPMQFFKYYVLRRHFSGGSKGFRFSLLYAQAKHNRIKAFLHAPRS
ncbi:Glycosyltransferase involved in cell wall bisynthesis [Faunimonas pinastri]|uniref:Glycosyltransferase involved in cell wall bisynthesis n=1 Tax=Faunimonas pinastri TaxID=1855383 RepID=A0A1H9AUF0_9HYPH|nr:glycosyltransferase family 2 protein [Faunimonas pinastri]SEP80165.1 Glycosyltransferase involved in cell wall bisynthesis [Faunimonas pinastri]